MFENVTEMRDFAPVISPTLEFAPSLTFGDFAPALTFGDFAPSLGLSGIGGI